MSVIEIIIGLVFVATVVSALAQRVGISYPIALMLGGLLLSLIPSIPTIQLDPNVIFLVFIPPLVYLPASQVRLIDIQKSWFPILMLSVGLVLVTLFAVAAVTHYAIPGYGWSASFLLAAIIAPTDMIAVLAVTRRSPLPRAVERVLDGESLFNDVVAFVAYKISLLAVLTNAYFPLATFVEFIWDLVAGIAAGLAVGYLSIWVRHRVQDPAVSSAASLLTSFAAYLGGEALGASGVLATVTAGLCVGRELSRILQPEARQGSFSFWGGVNFMLEGLAFVLIGLELRPTLQQLSQRSYSELIGDATVVIATVVLVRLVWVAAIFSLRHAVLALFQKDNRQSNWRHAAIVAWAGPRGVESLAAAIGIPLLIKDGTTGFPQREMTIFLSFSVIVFTLLVQGGTLSWLIRWLNLPPDHTESQEENLARLAASQAALDVLSNANSVSEEMVDQIQQLRRYYEHRVQFYLSTQAEMDHPLEVTSFKSSNDFLLTILHAKREAVLKLRDQGLISNSVLRHVERSFDYEQMRLS